MTLTPNDRLTMDRFEEALTVFLCADVDGAATAEHRSELATARGAMEKIVGAQREYAAAVDAAHREKTACMVARWQRPRPDHPGLVIHR